MYRLFLALRYLRSRLVNLISVGGVMAGVAVLIVVVSIMDGFQERVRSTVRGSLSHIILTPTTSAADLPPFEQLDSLLRAQPHIEASSPQSNLPVFYEFETERVSAVGHDGMAWHQMEMIGVDWEKEAGVSELPNYILASYDAENPFWHPLVSQREKDTVLVSRTFAQNYLIGQYDRDGNLINRYGALKDENNVPLKGRELLEGCKRLIGTELRIWWGAVRRSDGGDRDIKTNSKNLIISGVYDALDAVDDNRRLYCSLPQLTRMGGFEHSYLQAKVRLDDYEHAKGVQKSLANLLEGRFFVETWEDKKRMFLQAVDSEKVLLIVVLSFIILLAGFVILATLTLTVVEKTRDIGIVAALGATKRGILSIFVWNGLLIGILGAILGLGLGYWFTENVDNVRAAIKSVTGRDVFPPNLYHFETIPTIWDWPSVISIMIGAVIVAFVAGLLPALRAARLDPVAALRHE